MGRWQEPLCLVVLVGEIGKEPEGPFGSNVKNLNVRIKSIWAIIKRLETKEIFYILT